MTGTVNFVFCIDAEGPLYESTQACFERLRGLFGVKLPPPTEENLRLLQEGKIKLGGREKEVMQVVSPSVRDWLGNWKDVLENVRHTSAPEFRRQVLDDVGRGLVFNWFVCDWTEGFRHNPRRKPIGINLVFSHYHELFAKDPANNPLYFHHHCAPLSGCTHHPCKNWSTIPAHLAVISARLIEYGHFASCLRSPIMAPDIHLFAEQFFPFDMSNTAVPNDGQPDVMSRRWTDWEGAPADWSVYHPDFHDYRKPGALKRAIGRSMQCGSRYGNITERICGRPLSRRVRASRSLCRATCTTSLRYANAPDSSSFSTRSAATIPMCHSAMPAQWRHSAICSESSRARRLALR